MPPDKNMPSCASTSAHRETARWNAALNAMGSAPAGASASRELPKPRGSSTTSRSWLRCANAPVAPYRKNLCVASADSANGAPSARSAGIVDANATGSPRSRSTNSGFSPNGSRRTCHSLFTASATTHAWWPRKSASAEGPRASTSNSGSHASLGKLRRDSAAGSASAHSSRAFVTAPFSAATHRPRRRDTGCELRRSLIARRAHPIAKSPCSTTRASSRPRQCSARSADERRSLASPGWRASHERRTPKMPHTKGRYARSPPEGKARSHRAPSQFRALIRRTASRAAAGASRAAASSRSGRSTARCARRGSSWSASGTLRTRRCRAS